MVFELVEGVSTGAASGTEFCFSKHSRWISKNCCSSGLLTQFELSEPPTVLDTAPALRAIRGHP